MPRTVDHRAREYMADRMNSRGRAHGDVSTFPVAVPPLVVLQA